MKNQQPIQLRDEYIKRYNLLVDRAINNGETIPYLVYERYAILIDLWGTIVRRNSYDSRNKNSTKTNKKNKN